MNFAGVAQRERPGLKPQIDATRKDAGGSPAPRSRLRPSGYDGQATRSAVSGPADGVVREAARDYLTAIVAALVASAIAVYLFWR